MSNSYFNFNKSLSSTRWTSLYFESVLLVRREYSKTAVPSSKVRGALSERLSFPRREELKTVRARSLSPGAILRQTWNLCSAIVAYSDHSFFPVCGSFHFKPVFVCIFTVHADENWLENVRNHIQGRRNDLNMLLLRSTNYVSVLRVNIFFLGRRSVTSNDHMLHHPYINWGQRRTYSYMGSQAGACFEFFEKNELAAYGDGDKPSIPLPAMRK